MFGKMDFEQLKQAIAQLSPAEQEEISVFLGGLRTWRENMTRLIDGRNPQNWNSLEEVKNDLERGESA